MAAIVQMLPYVSQDFLEPFVEPPDTDLPQHWGSSETTVLQQQVAANMIAGRVLTLCTISHKHGF